MINTSCLSSLSGIIIHTEARRESVFHSATVVQCTSCCSNTGVISSVFLVWKWMAGWSSHHYKTRSSDRNISLLQESVSLLRQKRNRKLLITTEKKPTLLIWERYLVTTRKYLFTFVASWWLRALFEDPTVAALIWFPERLLPAACGCFVRIK